MSTSRWLSGVLVAFGLGLFTTRALLAQTETTIDVRNFEVLAVEGNSLVVRDQRGTHEYTVPDDFRFTVDGRPMSVKELKPGMKGTATVTTKTTITPVTVTETREAVVLEATQHSLTVRGADGVRRRFTKSELDKRGIQIIKDGAVISLGQVNRGDQITATIITNQPPVVVTEREVEMKLAEGKAEPPPAKEAPAAPAAAPAAATTAVPAAAPATPAATGAAPATAPQESNSSLLWVAILIVLAVIAFFFMRRKR
jgi:LPXTG-motif cell wall-anchored protein